MNQNNIINAALQVLPSSKNIHPYHIVDQAIEKIQKSGLKYVVCPFETVVEGELKQILQLVEEIHEICYKSGAESMMMYIKIQSARERDVLIQDKMEKYQQ
jgi:uncharacterized protein YqgV (UPF0045/DUF77 family)